MPLLQCCSPFCGAPYTCISAYRGSSASCFHWAGIKLKLLIELLWFYFLLLIKDSIFLPNSLVWYVWFGFVFSSGNSFSIQPILIRGSRYFDRFFVWLLNPIFSNSCSLFNLVESSSSIYYTLSWISLLIISTTSLLTPLLTPLLNAIIFYIFLNNIIVAPLLSSLLTAKWAGNVIFALSILENKLRIISESYSCFSSLSNSITKHFFEWIPGLDVSGEKKCVVSNVPNRKTCCDFYAFTKVNRHKSHKWF